MDLIQDNFANDPFLPSCRSTQDFVIELFCKVHAIVTVSKDPRALLWPSERVTLAMLFTLKGKGERPFYRWALRTLLGLFPDLPERTRLFRDIAAHHQWAQLFLAPPTGTGYVDSYGISLINSRRLGRSKRQIGKRGFCGGQWIVGVKLGLVINAQGRICAESVDTADRYDANAFAPIIQQFAPPAPRVMTILGDTNFHKGHEHGRDEKNRDPSNRVICQRFERSDRRLIETVLSMFTRVCSLKKLTERVWPYIRAHLAYATAMFNVLIDWDGDSTLHLARHSL